MIVAGKVILYRLHEVASLIALCVFPVRVEWTSKTRTPALQFVFEQTAEVDSILKQHAAKTLHVNQSRYEAAKNVCIDMVKGLRPTNPAEFSKALEALPAGAQ